MNAFLEPLEQTSVVYRRDRLRMACPPGVRALGREASLDGLSVHQARQRGGEGSVDQLHSSNVLYSKPGDSCSSRGLYGLWVDEWSQTRQHQAYRRSSGV